jgi:uncharacterized glyoxalase superfamily protein PhnB
MTVKPIPDGYHSVTPYLIVENAHQLLDFLKAAFGATEIFRHTRPDGTVGHAEVRISDSPVMIGEACKEFGAMPVAIYLYVPDTDVTYKQALQAGAISIMEPADQFYGDRNAGVKDPCGNSWWIATHIEDVSPEELDKRAAERFKEAHTA